MKLSKENLEIVKQLIDSAEEQSKAAILARQTWQMAIINSVEALDIRTHRMRTTDEILEALSGAMDSADPWLRENMSHIREYFALASRAVWSPSDLLIALTRLREDCNADPLTDFHVVGGAR